MNSIGEAVTSARAASGYVRAMELKRMLLQVLQVVKQVKGKRKELVLVMNQRVMLKPFPSLVQGQQQLEVGSQRLNINIAIGSRATWSPTYYKSRNIALLLLVPNELNKWLLDLYLDPQVINYNNIC